MKHFLYLLFSLLALGCSSIGDLFSGGSGTEGGNTEVAGVIWENNSPAINATVQLVPINIQPSSAIFDSQLVTTTTDQHGAFVAKVSENQKYRVIANHLVSNLKCISEIIEPQKGKQILVPPDTLQPPGNITIQLSTIQTVDPAIIWIPGTNIFDTIEANQSAVTLSNLPSGYYNNVLIAPLGNTSIIERHDSIAIISNATITSRVRILYTMELDLKTGNINDLAIVSQLKSWNYDVIAVNDDSLHDSLSRKRYMQDVNLVMIGTSTQNNPSILLTEFKNLNLPIIVANPAFFDDMDMTGLTIWKDYNGYYPLDPNYNFNDSIHIDSMELNSHQTTIPLPFNGKIPFFTTSQYPGWGKPVNDGIIIATLPNQDSLASIFAYPHGAKMVKILAPQKRLGFALFKSNMTVLTPEAWSTLRASLEWLILRD